MTILVDEQSKIWKRKVQHEQLSKEAHLKKATILFPLELFGALEGLAKARNTSISELVHTAVRQQYALSPRDNKRRTVAEKLKIIEEMKAAEFPFWSWQEMEKDYEETFFE